MLLIKKADPNLTLVQLGAQNLDIKKASIADQSDVIVKWRRLPESNRGPRICNPLHSHSAKAPLSFIVILESLYKTISYNNLAVFLHSLCENGTYYSAYKN